MNAKGRARGGLLTLALGVGVGIGLGLGIGVMGVSEDATAWAQAQAPSPSPLSPAWVLELGIGVELAANADADADAPPEPELVFTLGARRGGWALRLELGHALWQTPAWRLALAEDVQLGPWRGGVELILEEEPALALRLELLDEAGQAQLKLEAAAGREPAWTLSGRWRRPDTGLQLELSGLTIRVRAGAGPTLQSARLSWAPPGSSWATELRWRPARPAPWSARASADVGRGATLAAEAALTPGGHLKALNLSVEGSSGPWRWRVGLASTLSPEKLRVREGSLEIGAALGQSPPAARLYQLTWAWLVSDHFDLPIGRITTLELWEVAHR